MDESCLICFGRFCSEKLIPGGINVLMLSLLLLIMPVRQGYSQTGCPFSEDDAVADTLDPAGYYPLQVGNVWEYIERSGAVGGDPRSEEVIKDTLIAGDVFHKLKITTYAYNPYLITEASVTYRYLAHTDTAFVQWLQGRLEESPIRFRQDFNSCYLFQDQVLYVAEGGYHRSFEIEETGVPVNYTVSAIKSIGSSFSVIEDYAYGIGRVGSRGDPGLITNVVYARIDGQVYGTPLDSLFDIQVATEEKPILPHQQIRLEQYPNPFQSTAHFAFSLASPRQVTLRISDVLGRVVAQPLHEQVFPSGTHTVSWNVEQLPSGLYLAQVVVGGQPMVSTTLTRIR